jgi:dihydroorotase-like cyclic amidohydrolase
VYDVIFRQATVVDAHREETTDVAISGNRIAAVEPTIAASGHEEIDVTGLYLLPNRVASHGKVLKPARRRWQPVV